MQAQIIHTWGGAERFEAATLPDPTPGLGEVLVQVAATSVNPPTTSCARPARRSRLSCRRYSAATWRAGCWRWATALRARRGRRGLWLRRRRTRNAGCYAEMIAADARLLAPKPASLTLREAAALPAGHHHRVGRARARRRASRADGAGARRRRRGRSHSDPAREGAGRRSRHHRLLGREGRARTQPRRRPHDRLSGGTGRCLRRAPHRRQGLRRDLRRHRRQRHRRVLPGGAPQRRGRHHRFAIRRRPCAHAHQGALAPRRLHAHPNAARCRAHPARGRSARRCRQAPTRTWTRNASTSRPPPTPTATSKAGTRWARS